MKYKNFIIVLVFVFDIISKRGPLAQLVEQMTLNHWVKGSNPLGITNIYVI